MPLPKIELPMTSVKLPVSKKKVDIRPFTVKEEKILLLGSSATDTETINEILRQIIFNCTEGKVDSYKLSLADMEFLFTQLRKLSVGETVDYLSTCSSCGLQFDSEVDLNKLKVDMGSFEDIVKLDENISVKMRCPTQVDENHADGLNAEERILKLSVDCVESIFIDDETHEASELTKQEVAEFIDSLPGKAIKKLLDFFFKIPFCKVEQEVTCPNCKNKSTITLEGMANFFGI